MGVPHNSRIKPDFFMCDVLAECSIAARLLLITLSMLDHRDGVIRKDHQFIKTFAFYKDDSDIGELMSELVGIGAVAYVDDGVRIVEPERWFGPRPFHSASPAQQTYWASLRRARKRRAMPSRANKEQIAEIYQEARELTKQTGIPHHVDHVVPLASDYVCGLHVAANLQVITARENMEKGNKFEVDL